MAADTFLVQVPPRDTSAWCRQKPKPAEPVAVRGIAASPVLYDRLVDRLGESQHAGLRERRLRRCVRLTSNDRHAIIRLP